MADRKDGESPNAAFEEYYKRQAVCPEAEWPQFINVLQTPLPIVFRINGSGPFATSLRRRFESDFFSKLTASALSEDGQTFAPPRAMPWYPDRLAWHMSFSRAQLRKLPMLNSLHEFIKKENDAGTITRQEAVSMVPPLFLSVQPHHFVLDTCAAPGSKTFQMLEMLHSGPAVATGMVIANDADVKRCNLLAHQTKRMCSPCLLVTNHEGQLFPIVRPLKAKQARHGSLRFDRILCDVPCSGDGTLRKAPDIWRRWSVGNGNSLHPLQINITLQACRLLKVGGRLVYSTCTFNPIEDEAVVAAVLLATKGALRLVDASAELPALKRHPGLSTWQVQEAKTKDWYTSWSEAEGPTEQNGLRLDPTMFPSAETAALPLHHTMRFLPHDQDTGGFFVAVLEKVAECADLVVPTQKHRKKRKPAQAGEKDDGKRVKTDTSIAEPAKAAEPPSSRGVAAAELPSEVAPAAAEPPCADTSAAPTAAPATDAASPGRPSAAPPAADEASTSLVWGVRGGGGRGRDKARRHRALDPIVPVTAADLLDPVVEFYGLKAEFPLKTHLVTRSFETADRPRRCYYVSDATRQVLMLDESESLKVTTTGLKLLERQEVKDGSSPCIYRLSQDGLPFLLPFITKQRLRVSLHEMKTLLTSRAVRIPASVPYATFRPPTKEEAGKMEAAQGSVDKGGAATEEGVADAGAEQPAEQAAAVQRPVGGFAATANGQPAPLLERPSTLTQLGSICAGCCVVSLAEEDALRLGLPVDSKHTGGCLPSQAPMAVSCWRTKNTVNILVAKAEAELMLDKIEQLESEAGGQGADAAGVA